MSNSIEGLDFYPEDAETISALQQMAVLDQVREEGQFQQIQSRRIRIALAGAVTVVALSGAGNGLLFNKNAHENYHSVISQVPETAFGAVGGLCMGALLAAGGLNLLGRKYPFHQKVQ